MNNENMVDDVEISGEPDLGKDLEFTLQQINVDFGLHAGIYIYATEDGQINVSQVGLEQHCKILETEYVKWSLGKQPKEVESDA